MFRAFQIAYLKMARAFKFGLCDKPLPDNIQKGNTGNTFSWKEKINTGKTSATWILKKNGSRRRSKSLFDLGDFRNSVKEWLLIGLCVLFLRKTWN
jgi:hypothetical protein